MARKPRHRNRSSRNRRKHASSSDHSSNPNDLNFFSARNLNRFILIRQNLREESLQRAKKRPIRERILAFFRGEKNKDYKELIINTEALERRVARIENGILQGFDVERLDEDRMVGAIFKGKVQNLEPGLKAAFVDIGQEKNAFLHYWDMLPGANNDPSIEIVRKIRRRIRPRTKLNRSKISQRHFLLVLKSLFR